MSAIRFGLVLVFVVLLGSYAYADDADEEKKKKDAERLSELMQKGEKLLKKLPEIPEDYNRKIYFEIIEKDAPVGYAVVRIKAKKVDGELCYEYSNIYQFDVPRGQWIDGKITVIMDRHFRPITLEEDYELVSFRDGTVQRERNLKFGRKKLVKKGVFNGVPDKRRKVSLPKTKFVLLTEALAEQLPVDEGDEFALMNYSPLLGSFVTQTYKIIKEKKGRKRIEANVVVLLDDEGNEIDEEEGMEEESDVVQEGDDVGEVNIEHFVLDKNGRVVERDLLKSSVVWKKTTKKKYQRIKKRIETF